MIKVTNLHKYYNKGQNNEIHAVDDVNYSFPKTGLVCLLGPSGCGKTTLLNNIGGLDKPSKGTVAFKDKEMRGYRSRPWDLIRSRHFGYVFQNYYLLPELTIYQNLEFVLKIFDLPREEIDRRIEYALTAVGMFKYRKRKPYQLSGGQQQRAAIARALVKSPEVVVADEPTGNLDERNKTQIMNIIKKISAECLVVLVTHERRLAEFYGDEIIELRDGKITDIRENAGGGELTAQDDRNIYLPELKHEEINAGSLKIDYYYGERPAPLALKLIHHNGAYYIQGAGAEKIEIKVIDAHGEVKVIDAPRPVVRQADLYDFDYHLPPIKDGGKPARAAVRYRDTFKMALSGLGRLRRGQRFLLLILIFAAVMVVYAMTVFFSSFRVEESDFLKDNRNLVEIIGADGYEPDDYRELKEKLGVDYILGPHSQIGVREVDLQWFSQYPVGGSIGDNSFLPMELYDMEEKLLYGRLPEAPYEAVIDKYLIDLALEDAMFVASGIRYPEQFLDMEYYYFDDSHTTVGGKIVGIVDTGNPNVYLRTIDYRELMIFYHFTRSTYIRAAENADIAFYHPLSDWGQDEPATVDFDPAELAGDEIIVSDFYYQQLLTLRQEAAETVLYDKEYRIVGFFNTTGGEEAILAGENIENLFYYSLGKLPKYSSQNPVVFATDKEAMIAKLKDNGLAGKDVYRVLYRAHYAQNFSVRRYIFSLVIFAASLFFIYFLMRSSLIRRVYEVGVYRALGIKKSNVYRLFFSEIVILTLATSTFGVLATTYIVNRINALAKPFELIYFPWHIPPLSMIFIFLVNTVTGMLPVFSLLRKTPAQILSKYDI